MRGGGEEEEEEAVVVVVVVVVSHFLKLEFYSVFLKYQLSAQLF